MAKTAIIGIRGLILHKLTGETYEPGFENEGIRNFTREVEQELTKMFANNTVYDTQEGVKTITGEVTAYQFDNKMWEEFFGYQLENHGGYSDGATKNYGAMTVIMDRKDVDSQEMGYRVGVLYKNKFSEPSIEQTTTEDAVEYTELVAPFEGIESHILGANGKPISYYWFDVDGVSLSELIEYLLPAPILPSDEPINGGGSGQVGELPEVLVTTPTLTWTPLDDGVKTVADVIAEAGVTGMDAEDGTIIVDHCTIDGGPVLYLADPVDLNSPFPSDTVVTFEVTDGDGNISPSEYVTIHCEG